MAKYAKCVVLYYINSIMALYQYIIVLTYMYQYVKINLSNKETSQQIKRA